MSDPSVAADIAAGSAAATFARTVPFNAWRDAWVPVLDASEADVRLSLRDVFGRAHELRGLGRGLTPLDVESLLRFLPAIGVLVMRHTPLDVDDDRVSESVTGGRFLPESIEAFEADFDLSLFDLSGDRPFLQRWDRTCADIDALVDAKKGGDRIAKAMSVLRPIEQMHPHEPGASSAQWTVRRDLRDAADPTNLALLLVVAWFQTKNGNGKDAFGNGNPKGSTATWHVNPLSLFPIDRRSLGRTLYASMPAAWINGDAAPAFFDRSSMPHDVASNPLSLWRCTYAMTLPLIYWHEGRGVGFTLGADDTIPIPPLGADDKASLGEVHASDHTRLYSKAANTGVRKPRGAFGARLGHSEGFERWFSSSTDIASSVIDWLQVDRVLMPDNEDSSWNLGVFSEMTDGKGTRTWTDWADAMPLTVAGSSPERHLAFRLLMTVVSKARSLTYSGLKSATGESKDPAGVDAAQASLLNAFEPVLDGTMRDLADGIEAQMREVALELVRLANSTFAAATDPYLVPQNLERIYTARAAFAGSLRKIVNETYPVPDSDAGTAA